MAYTQLTPEQRYQIYALLKTEHSQIKIAAVIGVHKATISREVDVIEANDATDRNKRTV